MKRQFGFPFRIDAEGHTAGATEEAHICQLIEQVLFTSPGERVNRPDFGTGMLQMVFTPNSSEVASATQYLVQAGLQKWLGHILQVESVSVENLDAELHITVQYVVTQSRQRQITTFARQT
ncbi:MAG: GPW/gp25 family protein [Candidatus Marinimicrobia bacterium]|nr:GPW/gp25 family protein [Candidatus Neomarinimicrobiota bacterium]